MIALTHISRRGLLGGGLGLSVAFAGRSALAEAHRRNLIVIVARGGMDGLSVTPPIGDARYAELRGPLAIRAPLALDGDFGLHPALTNVHRLARAGQARFAPAAAIPVRERSHFEAQDVLESGAGRLYGAESGWLNRALQAMGAAPASALSVGAQTPLVLRGPVQAASWSPGPGRQATERVAALVQDLYKADALLGPAFATGLAAEAQAQAALEGSQTRPNDLRGLGATVARLMTAPAGPNIVALSLDGFDTHARQGAEQGQLAQRLSVLDGVIGGLETGLGPAWRNTVVVVATEFGRTARVNGTNGTDHGGASTALLAGGALKPGGLIGDWPTLAENRLFQNRELAAALDVRALFKGVLHDHLGIERAALDRAVFPGSDAVAPVEGLV